MKEQLDRIRGEGRITADQRYFILPEGELYPLDAHTDAIGLREFLAQIVPTL